jgi:hypothetical protein
LQKKNFCFACQKIKKRETQATFIDNRLAYENRLVIRVCKVTTKFFLRGTLRVFTNDLYRCRPTQKSCHNPFI